ncbi:TetR/AcrR family transcriptional regulator [Sphaerisporangium fuscum]|uniref:TetR/AcrR family transcriptional regulator n=1 Tax=Sphaerisporangium fuscum TaxID=2835868 RepID=UPI001BDBD247|nr:TetR/AcrR family transcriptional regulator [Sphaerisporangium fuscum]
MNRKRGAATREQLIGIATRLFAEHGYEDTPIEAVLQEAGMSRGALYHHFAGKEALFEAVLEAVEADTSRKTVEATRGAPDPVAALHAGALAWIRLAGDPVVRRILLIDAPSVIGWERWREMEERYVFGLLRAALHATGAVPSELLDVFAHSLLAALNEIALLIARSDDPAQATRTAETAVAELLRRLLA